jgi:hypothetical protein
VENGGYYALESTHVCNTPFRLPRHCSERLELRATGASQLICLGGPPGADSDSFGDTSSEVDTCIALAKFEQHKLSNDGRIQYIECATARLFLALYGTLAHVPEYPVILWQQNLNFVRLARKALSFYAEAVLRASIT